MQRFGWVLLFLATGPITPQTLKITVRVFDQTAISKQIVDRAEGEATYAAQKSGFAIEWINCARRPEQCSSELASNELVVLISPYPQAKRSGKKFGEAGRAYLDSSRRGAYSVVYYDQVLYAMQEQNGCVTLLAYTMLHELGHSLGLHHRPQGVMKPHWDARDLALMSRRQLCFNRTESCQLQAEIDKRSKAVMEKLFADSRASLN